MAEHIGIVACSVPGAALCYQAIGAEGAALMGEWAHPEVSMHNISLAEYMAFIDRGDWEGVAGLMLRSAERLAAAGADFLICPDNTVHQAFPWILPRTPLPWMHIAEEVANEAKRRGFRRIAVTGTKFLMEGPVYPETLEAAGLEWRIPPADARVRINEIIFRELVYGKITAEALAYFQRVIEAMKADGCDAVALSCTEIPLLVNDCNSPLPTLDSTRLLARAALCRAVGGLRAVPR
jgi:aspartate racemase